MAINNEQSSPITKTILVIGLSSLILSIPQQRGTLNPSSEARAPSYQLADDNVTGGFLGIDEVLVSDEQIRHGRRLLHLLQYEVEQPANPNARLIHLLGLPVFDDLITFGHQILSVAVLR